MLMFGILLFIIQIAVSNLINPILYIIIAIIFGLVFNKLYVKYVANKIKKIKLQHPESSLDDLQTLCSSKGGTSIPRLIIGCVIQIITIIIIVIILIVTGAVSLFGGLLSDFAKSTKSGLNGTYDGVIINDTSVNMSKEFKLTPTGPFEDNSNKYS